ncbi:MAG: FAD-binding protein [Deltaproteobacteria bacterium]|nr:FAD-binding protein [Deltaproteobacteria bacterium]
MEWDRETDVIVVGYGGAGGMAAIAAHDAGASVLILEKMSQEGGTTRTSGGRMRIVLDPERAVDFYNKICEGTTPRDLLQTYVYEGLKVPEWIRALGGEVEESVDGPHHYPLHLEPDIAGADSISPNRHRVKGPFGSKEKSGGGGANLITLLVKNVTQRKIEVLLDTPATKLITNEEGGVIGLEARHKGNPLRIKAKRGVILTCGGFSANPAMLLEYVGQNYYLPYCNPGNTGDGIHMVMEIGADLWHMSAVVAGFGYKVPDYDYPVPHKMPLPGYVYVDQKAKRFMNETGVDSHLMWTQVFYWDVRTCSYPRVPCFVIFDADTFGAGPIATTLRGKIGDVYQWSEDNQPELERGWIAQAETIDLLAKKIEVSPETLQETISRYNMSCIGGYDPEFNRTLQTLSPVMRPPFYAMRLFPCVLNTQGGARRNARAQVLNVHGNPIPRLYSAGEFGSLFHRFYIGAGNVRECIVFGRIAGQNAAAETPWK